MILFPLMTPHMLVVVKRVRETFLALLTIKLEDPSVNAHVSVKVSSIGKHLVAFAAPKTLFLQSHFVHDMLIFHLALFIRIQARTVLHC